jgi:hypothetical protein
VALPDTGAGRVCGTSASSEPSVSTNSVSNSVASPEISSANVRQRRFGSTPSSRIASRPAPGSGACRNVVSGQSTCRVIPSESETMGRVAWKSKKFSGSIDANGCAAQARARYAAASDAPCPPSFQPRKAAIRTGRSSCGRSS